jgi:hypothetical protein
MIQTRVSRGGVREDDGEDEGEALTLFSKF